MGLTREELELQHSPVPAPAPVPAPQRKFKPDADIATIDDLGKVVHTCLLRWSATEDFSHQIASKILQGIPKGHGNCAGQSSSLELLATCDRLVPAGLLPEDGAEHLFEPPTRAQLGHDGKHFARFEATVATIVVKVAVLALKDVNTQEVLHSPDLSWECRDSGDEVMQKKDLQEDALREAAKSIMERALCDALGGCGVFEDMADTIEESMLLGARAMATGQPLQGASHLWRAISHQEILTSQQVSRRMSSEVSGESRKIQALLADPDAAALVGDDAMYGDGDDFGKDLFGRCQEDLSSAFEALDQLTAEVKSLDGLLA